MIKYCSDCALVKFNVIKHNGIATGDVEVMCTSELAPESWRNKFIRHFKGQPKKMCPVPEKWFKDKNYG